MLAGTAAALLGAALAAFGAAWWLGLERARRYRPRFDPAQIGPDPEAWLAAREAEVPRLRPGTAKRIVWADPGGRGRTPLSVVYVHGFSATAEELRPLPDQIAAALGANLHFTRLTGHGADADAMRAATLEAWQEDLAEALAIGRAIGERVLLIACSTGATLATLAMAREGGRAGVAGVVFVSPNFGVRARWSWVLSLPFARRFVPLLGGEMRSIPPVNAEHAKWWTITYPSVALVPMGQAVAAALGARLRRIGLPAMFVLSDADRVVRADLARRVAARWGASGAEILALDIGPEMEPSAHVIAGWICSPGLTAPVRDAVLDWARRAGVA